MNREEILSMSREENKDQHDERETLVWEMSAKTGMRAGMIVCALLTFINGVFLHIPEVSLASWLVCFTMQGSSNLAIHRALNDRRCLMWGLVEITFAMVFAAMFLSRAG